MISAGENACDRAEPGAGFPCAAAGASLMAWDQRGARLEQGGPGFGAAPMRLDIGASAADKLAAISTAATGERGPHTAAASIVRRRAVLRQCRHRRRCRMKDNVVRGVG